MSTRMRSFRYSCSCGYQVKVFIDFGIPQELYRCRKCGNSVKREEI